MKKTISLILFIFWLGLIFYLSHQPSEVSEETSRIFVDFFVKALNFINIQVEVETLSFLVRKMAHFFLYFVLGVLTLNLVQQYQIYADLKSQIVLALLFCVFYATTDEIHQIFIPGRSGEISDVLLDSLGSISGIFLMVKWQAYGIIKKGGYDGSKSS